MGNFSLSPSPSSMADLVDTRLIRNTDGSPVQRWARLKRIGDVLGALTLIVLLSPLLLTITALLWLEGSAWFGHRRVGRGGSEFKCLKFRTMVPDAQRLLDDVLANDPSLRHEWQQTRKLRHDPRVTRVGALLRSSSLDELPQLFNVVRGDMSLVGPRPVVRDELAMYGDSAAYYLSVRPGMTGLWQVSGRSGTTYAQRVTLDCEYVARRSLLLDLQILVRTAGALVSRDGAC